MGRGPRNRRQFFTCKDVKQVHSLIEHCLKQFMKKGEVVELLSEMGIKPDFTKLVWKKLEEENKEFFNTYYAIFARKQKISQLNKLPEEQRQSRNLTAIESLTTFDGSYNPSVLSQPNSNVGLFPNSNGLHNYAVLTQPSSNFDGSHNPSVLSQPNSNVGLTVIPSLPTLDRLPKHEASSQPNLNFDRFHDLSVLSQPNSYDGLTAIATLPTLDGLHNPTNISQASYNFDGLNNLGIFSQPNSNGDLTSVASLFSFDGLHNPATLLQPNSNEAHFPPIPYYTAEEIEGDLMLANMQQLDCPSSYNLINNGGLSLQTCMHGGAVDVFSHGNGNWINGHSNMFSNQSADMGLIQGTNARMIESRPEDSNGGNSISIDFGTFIGGSAPTI